MRLTKQTGHAIRILIECTLAKDQLVKVADVSDRLGVTKQNVFKIVNLLARSEEPVCACEFVPPLGLAQATVSHHLKKLTQSGLLEREQRGKWAYFSLNSEVAAQLVSLVRIPEVV